MEKKYLICRHGSHIMFFHVILMISIFLMNSRVEALQNMLRIVL